MMSVGPDSKVICLAGSASVAVPKNTAVWTDAIDLHGLEEFTLSYKASGTGTVGCKIELEQSLVPPTGANVTDGNFVVAEGQQPIVDGLNDKLQHHAKIYPVCIRYMRLKITEQTNVMTNLTLDLQLSVQKHLHSN